MEQNITVIEVVEGRCGLVGQDGQGGAVWCSTSLLVRDGMQSHQVNERHQLEIECT